MTAAAVVAAGPPDQDRVAAEDLTLDEEEASIVAAEAAAAANVLPELLRSRALALAEVAPTGGVPAELVEALEYVATTSLTGGRARRRYTAEGEKLLNRVLARTPGGRARAASVAEVNAALGSLAGRELHGVRVATRVPGSHTVRLDVDGVVLTLGLSAAGVTVESVAL
ncbi:MAG TPA: hypothetical protein VFN21_00440 [Acidimicrobiales bacterium]|nr:hypothetical protein [Acidimicrobiales bacterium]